jgi:two-component system, OmpR family, sensor kinase
VVSGLSKELGAISESANHLLMRLDEALKTERALAANAAHELRTPLAAARLSLSTAQAYPMSEAAQEATRKASASLDTLSNRAEKLLQLSRAEASATLTQAPVNLCTLAREVVDELSQTAMAIGRIKLNCPDIEDLTALGDFDSLAIALRNLIENSLKYAPQSDVWVLVTRPAHISVRDAGAVAVIAQDMQRLRERHMRMASNQAGYGLGLSIARTIIGKQGGVLKLHSPPLGYAQGFEAVLELKPLLSG